MSIVDKSTYPKFCYICNKELEPKRVKNYCHECFPFHGKNINKFQSKLYEFFEKFDYETRYRILNYLEEQEKIFSFSTPTHMQY